ncbi:MAG: metal ABC transporter permease [Patescibacteria group bacterium]|nr:metal ABC transporter permease [Patescibacteria group bacterium]
MTSHFLYSLVTGIFVGGIAGYLGTLMLLKKMTVAVDPLSHFVLPGVGLAVLMSFDPSLGAFASILLGVVAVWILETKTKLPTETLIAVLFTAGVAIALLIAPSGSLEEIFTGDILLIGPWSAGIAAAASLLIFFVLQKIYSKIILMEISEDLAKMEGVNTKKYLLVYLIALALVVALEVKLVGGLMTAALVAVPAVTARLLSRNLRQYAVLGIVFGIVFSVAGILLSQAISQPAGILITLTAVTVFMVVFLLKSLALRKS